MRSAFDPLGSQPPEPSRRVAAQKPNALVETEGGVVVRRDIVTALARADRGPSTYDENGRRRIMVDRKFRRAISTVIGELAGQGLGLHIVCNMPRPDGVMSCGEPMQAIGEPGGADAGYVCGCQRIYFR